MNPHLLKLAGKWLLLGLLMTVAQNIYAQSRSGIILRKVLDGAEGRLAVDSAVQVQDTVFFNASLSNKLDTPYPVRNIITFRINEYSSLYLPATFTATVSVRIEYTKADLSVDHIDRELQLNYDTANPYTARSSFVFSNSHRVNVKVLSFNTNASKNILPALLLENEMELQPVYKLSCTEDAVKSIASNNPPVTDTTDEVVVNWPVTLGADVYDLEWAYIDSSALESGRYGNPALAARIFENNTTRVTISGNSYAIPLLYDNGGVLYFRARAVQEKKDYARMETAWSSDYPGGLGAYSFCGHQRNLNWQSSISFAEDGKRKVVVQYFDGSLRNRQTVTKDNTTNTTVVAETMYDYQGRPAIQVMPAPTLNNILKYTARLNPAVNGAEYDKDNYDHLESPADFLLASAKPMGTSSGANQYYSSANPEKLNGVNQFIPDAEGRAFSETEYTQDNTGRISRVSGLGPVFKLGGGHETKYTYGTPAQEDLDALFGTEAGVNLHYFKTMVRDANGQYSVSYTDMSGKTIATALAGSPRNVTLNDLPSKDVSEKTDSLSGEGKNVIRDLRLESSKSQTVVQDGIYRFKYELTPPVLQKPDCNGQPVCYNALYDLSIRITDDAYNQRLGGKPFDTLVRNFHVDSINTSCIPRPISLEFDIYLTEGSYEITKSLSINREAMEYYRDSIFLKSGVCTSVERIIEEKKEEQRALDCFPTCESCIDSIGTWDQFRVKYVVDAGYDMADTAVYRNEAMAAYQEAKAACDELCGTATENDDIRRMLLQDMMPPSGQYANLADARSEYSIFYFLNENTVIPYARDSIRYLDENGNPDLVYDDNTGLYVAPNKLSKTDFVQKFKSSWGEALLKYHPEYCKYLARLKFGPAAQWDKAFAETESYQEAKTKGYLNPLASAGISFPAGNDPIKQLDPQALLAGRLMNYNGTGTSLWNIATIGAKCPEADLACINSYKTLDKAFDESKLCAGDLDMAWRNFREMYLAQKNDVISRLIAQNLVCPPGKVTPTPARLLTDSIPKNSRFNNLEEAVKQAGLDGYTNPANKEQPMRDSANAIQARLYETNCRAYVKMWLEQLAPCTSYNSAALAEITEKLVGLCKEGADGDHPRGASTVRPASTYRYRSFEQVIKEYNDQHGITDAMNCSALRLTLPKPYGKQPAYTNGITYTKPQECECNKLKDLQQEYAAIKKPSDTSFAVYLLRTRGVRIPQSELNILLDACAPATAVECTYLPKPVTIPALIMCRPAPACVPCDAVRTAHTDFLEAYPDILPTLEGMDSLQQSKNELFAVYMNNRFGFGMQAWQYLNYLDSCDVPPAGLISAEICRPGNPRYKQMVTTYAKSGTDIIADIQSAADSGYVMAGATTGSGFGGKDAYIIKTGKTGAVNWSKTFGGESNDEFVRIRTTRDSGYIAIGNTSSYCYDLGAMLVVKLDKTGNILWNKVVDFGLTHGAKGTDVIELADGKFAFAGLRTTAGVNTDWVMGVLDESGEMNWMKQIGSAAARQQVSLAEHQDTLVAATGITALADDDAVILKLRKQTGDVLKSDQYDIEGKNNIISGLLGTAEGYKLSIVDMNAPGETAGDGVLVDVNRAGEVTVAQKVPSAAGGVSPSSWVVAAASDGGYYATQSSTDVYWHKIRKDNSVQWSRQVRMAGADRLFRFIQDRRGGDLVGAGIYDGQRAMLMMSDFSGRTGCNDTLVSMESSDITSAAIRKTLAQQTEVKLNSTHISTVHVGEAFVMLGTGIVSCPGTDSCFTVSTAPMLCGSANAVYDDFPLNDVSNCSDSTEFAVSTGTERFNYYLDSVKNDFNQAYVKSALEAAVKEEFAVTYTSSEYHYTLYYYDQAGNLVKTVPPAGVVKDRSAAWLAQVKTARKAGARLVPAHSMETNYRYNTLNQVVAQHTPDGGTSHFWYDRLGRLVTSRNAQQVLDSRYSYTQYDWLGRITEVGELTSTNPMTDAISRKETDLVNWLNTAAASRTQITRTMYDTYTPLEGLVWNAHNLRNRVAWSAVYNTAADVGMPGGHASASFYDYDIHGNVKVLLQDFNNRQPGNSANRFKKIVYDYDLISGKVNQVSYQPGQLDAFYHRYSYDAENKLTNVETSQDSVYWENDAYYQYYRHGALARSILGQQQVQGVDYAYTLQGWLKGVNSTALTPGFDIGGDGTDGAITARDAFGYSLNYFGSEDYKPVNATVKPFAAVGGAIRSLYNGNISAMSVNIPRAGEPLLYSYNYDVLNRLAGMQAARNLNVADNTWSPVSVDDFKERITYDANGNILSYARNGNNTWAGKPLEMDKMSYHYVPGKNRLTHIIDTVPVGNYEEDIDSMVVNNYAYDAIGNLVGDQKEGLTIEWTVYGKIRKITKTNGTTITYTYDVTGNRLSKNVNGVETRYIRDATGNVMAVYVSGDGNVNGGDLSLTESHVYGSQRLGIRDAKINLQNPAAIPVVGLGDHGTGISLSFVRGLKQYELSNHLGNVLAGVGDVKIAYSGDGNVVDYYTVKSKFAQDYYPFGMQMVGRGWSSGGYRYGFNGKENDNEVKGEGNQQDYGMRVYDPRIGKFLSVDPLASYYPFYTPYQFASNNPILAVDIDGLESSDDKNPTAKGITLREVEIKGTRPEGQKRSTSVRNTSGNGRFSAYSSITEYYHSGSLNSASGWYSRDKYKEITAPYLKSVLHYGGRLPFPEKWAGEIDKGTGFVFSRDFSEDFFEVNGDALAYEKAVASMSGRIDLSAIQPTDLLGLGTALFSKSGKVFSFTGKTFAQYKAARGGTRTLAMLETTNGAGQTVLQRISIEYHHVFVTQRMQKALNLPNWLVNNRLNVWKLNTVQHSLLDKYRFNFLRAGFKNEVGWLKANNWFTKYTD